MTWFKVDDSFYDHPKVDDLPDAAIALWTRAGSYCAKHLTDGRIPKRKARRMCDDPDVAIPALLKVGMWSEDGDDYLFHDWSEYQPARESVLAEREANAQRQKTWRERRKAERDAARNAALTRDKQPANPVSNGHSNGVTNVLRNESVAPLVTGAPTRPVPARPDPAVVPKGTTTGEDQTLLPRTACAADDEPNSLTIPGTDVEPAAAAPKQRRGSRLPDGWVPSLATRDWQAKEFPGLDVRTEHLKFTNYWLAKTGRDASKVDWDRTWQNWMITAAERTGVRRGAPARVTSTPDGRTIHQKTAAHADHLAAYGDD